MEKPRPSTIASAALIAGVALWDFNCGDGETITERVWDLQESKFGRALAIAAIGTTALHLLHVLPPSVDPFVHMGKLKRRRDDA